MPQEYSKTQADRAEFGAVCQTLHLCVDTFLRALAPFMPYLCEELYQRLPGTTHPSVCVAPYPIPDQVNTVIK